MSRDEIQMPITYRTQQTVSETDELSRPSSHRSERVFHLPLGTRLLDIHEPPIVLASVTVSSLRKADSPSFLQGAVSQKKQVVVESSW